METKHIKKINELQLQLNELREAQDQNQKNTYSQVVKNNTTNNLNNNRNNYYNNKNIMTNNNKNPEGNGHTFSQQKNEDPGCVPQRGMMNNNDGNIMNNYTPTTRGQHSHNETNTNNVEIMEIIDYISNAMRTLGEFEKRLKEQSSTMPIPSATS